MSEFHRSLQKKIRLGESFIKAVLFLCALVSIATILSVIIVLTTESSLFFKDVTFGEFITGTKWQPTINQFGVLPLITATLVITTISLLVSLPFGLGVAIFLSEYSSEKLRKILKPIMEILAGIPSVVYGYFALTVVTPLLQKMIGKGNIGIYNMLAAGLVMGVMIMPTVSSMSEDALRAVPRSLREAAYGLGATKAETTIGIVLPAAMSGISASIILGISRAVGETMIVTIAAGSGSNFTINPLKAAETLTGYIARISGGDVSYDTPDYNSIFALGLFLFAVTFLLNLISRFLSKKYREVYE